jgi:ribose 5-phosphate isomerase B
MHLIIGSDHAGYALKEHLKVHLEATGNLVEDMGPQSSDSVDYPDYAHAVAAAVQAATGQLGIVICGSGNGVNISANKHPGVRSALAWIPEIASLARAHNNANVLALPARYISESDAVQIVDAFLAAGFEGGRHERRVEKIELPA